MQQAAQCLRHSPLAGMTRRNKYRDCGADVAARISQHFSPAIEMIISDAEMKEQKPARTPAAAEHDGFSGLRAFQAFFFRHFLWRAAFLSLPALLFPWPQESPSLLHVFARSARTAVTLSILFQHDFEN